MKGTNVVQLGPVRDLLAEVEKVRQHILTREIGGFCLTLQGADGAETIYMGGIYKADPKQAVRAALRMSAAMLTAGGG